MQEKNYGILKEKTGSGSKNIKANQDFLVPPRPLNPYKLPDSDETVYEPYVLKGHKKIAVFADLHIPYHSIKSITAALDYCKKEKPDGLVLLGDALDFHALSRFQKDPRKKHFKQELDTFKAMFEAFQKTLKCKIYYKLGNHCERYENFLFQKAGELVGIEEFEFANILKARANGIEVIGDKRIMKANSLNMVHGHEFGMSVFNPVNIARGLYLKGKVSALQGHHHVSSEHSESA
jgi:predicted phosphodiesterase